MAGQVIVPFAFMVGAITSILVRQRGRQLYRQVAQRPAQDSLKGLNWREFEILMLEWFAQQGYRVQDTQLGADRGVDIVLRKAGKPTSSSASTGGPTRSVSVSCGNCATSWPAKALPEDMS